MMSVDEDTELRDLIAKNLEKNGVVGRIKAELRASVFLALEEEGCLKDRIPIVNKPLMTFIDTPHGKAMTSMVREFLEFFNMNFTLSVFDPESSNPSLFSREELCNKFNLKYVNDNQPILMHLLNREEGSGDRLEVEEIPARKKTYMYETTVESSTTSVKYNNDELVKKTLSDPFFNDPSSNESSLSNLHGSNISEFKNVETSFSNLQFRGASITEHKKEEFFTSDLLNLNYPKTFSAEGGSSESSLASLRDLPALDIVSGKRPRSKEEFPVLAKSTIPPRSEVIEDSVNVNKEPSSKKYGIESDENSEQSIEEDISLGFGTLSCDSSNSEDSTKDNSVSQISNLTNTDHVEHLTKQ